MGYSTDFVGRFDLDQPLTEAQFKYLYYFGSTRRMWRNAERAALLPDPYRQAAGLPIGDCGMYFVGNTKDFGQEHDSSVVEYNSPPPDVPDLWCQWVPTEDRRGIVWDENEKFYHYVEWLEFIIAHFLLPWGLTLSGSVKWQGEDPQDSGTITVVSNVVAAVEDNPKQPKACPHCGHVLGAA